MVNFTLFLHFVQASLWLQLFLLFLGHGNGIYQFTAGYYKNHRR